MKKALSFVLAAAMAVSVFTVVAVSGGTKVQAATSTVTLNVMAPDNAGVAPARAKTWMWQQYEKMSGVHINWTEIPSASETTKVQTSIASGQLPDMFYQMPGAVTPAMAATYGSQGIFVRIDDKMSQLPNLSALFKTIPSLKPAMTSYDGHMYGFPYIMQDPVDVSLRYYINTKYLKQTNLSAPTTIAQLTNVFAAFSKLKAPGGAAVYPLYLISGGFPWAFEQQLMGSYGLGENGLEQISTMCYDTGNGKLGLIYSDNKMKELWQQCAAWWKAGYMNPGTFTGAYDNNKWQSDGAKGLVGVYDWVGANILYATAPADYTAVNSLKGPYSNTCSWYDCPVRATTSAVITKACKNVSAALKWLDYWYSPAGSKFGMMGTLNQTYTMVAGVPQYIKAITGYKGGTQLGAFQYGLLVYGGYYPFIEPSKALYYQINNTNSMAVSGTTDAAVAKVAPKEVWPSFSENASETQQLSAISTDFNNYLNTARVNFITGKWNFTSDWTSYVNQLNKLGAKTIVSCRQAEYNRYEKSMS